ncbi:MAG: DUF3079 domain-containing protein [Vicinamibacterales bacterium]
MAQPPLRPAHPERTCWGCDRYCPATDLACGNGTVRTQHPCELFGDDWLTWAERETSDGPDAIETPPEPAHDDPDAA